ncbi:TetR/AcrR family transcriptional regulator [Ruminococcaceae bacterium OttesenSCG-928-I18]|nr:TetR/AcrR family transcriptional regulator [Ruminococcaceae bacterium OttesenSCG-928-I18]
MRISKPPHQRKAELVTAARRLFDKYGIDKTRVSDIVREVGVAQGVFYYYFTSKEEIISAVIEQVGAELARQADAILAEKKAPFCQKLAAFIELYLSLIDQFLADDETSLSSLDTNALEQNKLVGYSSTLITEKLLQLVRQGAAKSEVTAAYPEETVQVLLQGLRAYAAQKLPSRHLIYTLTEQSLCLPGGCLVQYSDKKQVF